MRPPATTLLDTIRAEALASRRLKAQSRADEVLARLAQLGVTAQIIGSLAEGRFRAHSDVDFLVTRCPRDKKYTIEADVEDIMGDIPFDVLYADEVFRAERPASA